MGAYIVIFMCWVGCETGERSVVHPQEIFGHAYSNRVCILRSLFFFKDASIVFFNIYIFHSSLSNFAL